MSRIRNTAFWRCRIRICKVTYFDSENWHPDILILLVYCPQVHLTEDHLLSESESLYKLNQETSKRKGKCLAFLKAERARQREERRRNRKETLEAYLDAAGELRIRRAADREAGDKLTITANRSEISVDNDENEVEFEMRASDYMKMAAEERTGAQFAFGLASKGGGGLLEKGGPRQRKRKGGSRVLKEEVVPAAVETSKRKMGRPRGSKTYGLTALRKVNPNVFISDGLMGERCGVDNCAVRLKVLF
jgi:hypothetical protein